MVEDKNKIGEVGFDTLVEKLKKHGGPQAEALASDIKGSIKRALYLVSGEADEEKEKNAEKKRQFIIELAFKEGDMKKGYMDSIGLSQGDLDKMGELRIGFSYSGDVMFDVSANGQVIPFIMPDGKSGSLFIKVDAEKGEFKYDFRKDISRREEKNQKVLKAV